MSKTRRQRSLEHPDMPKKGIRDKRRVVKEKNPAAVELGRLGGQTFQKVRGFQHLTAEERKRVAMMGVEGRKKKSMGEEGYANLKEVVNL